MPIRRFTTKDITITPNLDQFGGVYSFDFQPSAGETSSTLYINIVNQIGFYDVNFLKKAMSYLDGFRFDILGGDQAGGLTLFAFLVGYSESISNQSKTIRLEFKDGAHILDRIYVALLNKEIQASSQNSVPELKTFSKKIFCETCDLLNEKERFSVKTLNQHRIINNASHPLSRAVFGENIYGSPITGGVILVGRDKFTKTSCDMPDCDYNFTELKNAAAKIGVFINIPDLFPFYRVSDSGTLKEKLAHFCSKFGFGFRYDFSKNPRFGHYIYPTETPVGNNNVYGKLEILKEFAKNFKSLNPKDPVVINIADEESIDSTEKRFTSLLVKKNGEYNEKTKTVNYKAVLNPVKLKDVMKFNTQHSGFRSEEELISSSVVGKYSKVARVLYNVALSQSGKKPRNLIPLGFLPLAQLKGDQEKIEYIKGKSVPVKAEVNKTMEKWHAFFENSKLIPDYVEASKYPRRIKWNPEVFDVYIGVYSEENEKKYEKLETDVLKFLGKYYFNFITPNAVEPINHSSFVEGEITVKLTPESKSYFISDKVCSEVVPKNQPSPVPLNISAISSHDGEIVSAVENVGENLNSTNSGETWTKDDLPGNKPWTCVASSKNGEVVFSASSDGGIYGSMDSGQTWIVRRGDSLKWTSIACSSDGKTVYAVNSSEAKYYKSRDYGFTWDEEVHFILDPRLGLLSSIICSADGEARLGVAMGGSFLTLGVGVPAGFPVQLDMSITNLPPITCAACSDDGKTVFLSLGGGFIYRSQNYGYTDSWKPMELSPHESWSSVSCSSDGKKVTALTSKGELYISSDSGFSWILKKEIKGWRAVIVSRNGEKILGSTLDKKFFHLLFPKATLDGSFEEVLIKDASSISTGGENIAIVQSGGTILTSKDLGKTWISHHDDPKNWVDVDSSSSGKNIFSVNDDNGSYVAFSEDFGQTWLNLIENIPYFDPRKWTSIACSWDGKNVYAVDSLTGRLFCWKDERTRFDPPAPSSMSVEVSAPNEGVGAGPVQSFTSIACSGDGSRLILSTLSGRIYECDLVPNVPALFVFSISKENAGSISCVACSGDGQLLFFTVNGSFIYRKDNNIGNKVWTETNSSKENWVSISCSGSGKEAIALTSKGDLHVSSDFGAKWVLQAHPKTWKVATISKDGKTITGTVTDGRLFAVPFTDEVPASSTRTSKIEGELVFDESNPSTIDSEIKPKIECRPSSCSGLPLPFVDIMEGGMLPDGSKLFSPTDNKITIHERNPVFSGDDQMIAELLQQVTIRIEKHGCLTALESTEDVSNPLDIFKPMFFKINGQVSNYDVTVLDTKDIIAKLQLANFSSMAAKSSAGVVLDDRDKQNIINYTCLISPSKKLIDRLFKISPIHSAINTKDKTWFLETQARKIEEIKTSTNFCKAQEDPSSENDVKEIKDAVTGRFFTNPCYCKSSPFSGETEVFDPNKKPHITGLKNNIASGFVIELGEIFGKSHETLISLDQNLSPGELQVTLPCGTLLKDSILEEYAANFSETIRRAMYYYGFIKTLNNFSPIIHAAKINVSHEDLSSLVYREFSNPKVFSNFANGVGQLTNVPLEIENPMGAGFVSLLQYFDMIKTIEEKSSIISPRKKLTITLAATDSLGAFVNFLKASDGFSSISIEKSNDVLNLSLSFENKPPKKFDMFREISSMAKIGREF